MQERLFLAPLQGITEYIYRKVFYKHFAGIDAMYTPYLRMDNNFEIKKSKLKDVLPENNDNLPVVPQIMTNKADEFIHMAKMLHDFGYKEVNWNLGCPYPMVTNRQLGSGLLPHPEIIEEILEQSINKISLELSIKMRLGLELDDEIYSVLSVLNKYPIKEITIHPRIAKQLYKGKINLQGFQKCLSMTNHSVVYNGDINSLDDIEGFKSQFDSIHSWMLGRGVIANPFLAEQIKSVEVTAPQIDRFRNFHDDLANNYLQLSNGFSHFHNKIKGFWTYFALSFSNSHKTFKKIKKANTESKYFAAINDIFHNEEWIA